MKYFNVVVTDKPNAAKTIAEILSGGNYKERRGKQIFDFNSNVYNKNCEMIITSTCFDGLKNMLEYCFVEDYDSWNSCDPKDCFDLEITNYFAKTLEVEIDEIDSEIGLIIWTDCHWKEIEILYEVQKVYEKLDKKMPIYRANISEYNENTIPNALAYLEKLDLSQNNFMDSIAVRKEIDLRIGAAFTRYQTMRWQDKIPNFIKYREQLSYGSCQIPTLGFVVDRYKEIEQFVPEIFWKLNVVHTIHDLKIEFNWDRNRLFEKDSCEKYLSLCLANPKATVENVTLQVKTKSRPIPMNTAELLKLCSRKLNININDTIKIALELHNEGLISYPKTETNCFSPDMNLRSLVEQHTSHSDWGGFANRVLEWGPNPQNGNKSDQAHPPIHPTKFTTNLNGNEARVYELIVRHFLACVSKDATGSETSVTIDIAGEKFHATGLVIQERNYLDVYLYEKWNPKQIHNYEKEQVFSPTALTKEEGATTAPSLLTNVDLIQLMVKHGIGRDGTYATHIQTLKDRKYIGEKIAEKDDFEIFLKPLPRGIFLYDGYNAIQLNLTKPELRADFEKDLNAIRLGLKDANVVLTKQKNLYKEIYEKLEGNIIVMDEILKKMYQPESLSTEITTSMNSNDQSLDSQASEGECSTVCGTCEDVSIKSTKRKSDSAEHNIIKSPKK